MSTVRTMSDDSSFNVRADNRRVLMSEQLKDVVEDENLVTDDVVENFVSVILHFNAGSLIVAGTLVGIKNSESHMVVSAKVMYDDALTLTMSTPVQLKEFELHHGNDVQKFGAHMKIDSCEMFDLNPSVGMCTIALELRRF